jgi:4-amino-4-deoxy-L-arabinose transferase-like glycosyltransferase
MAETVENRTPSPKDAAARSTGGNRSIWLVVAAGVLLRALLALLAGRPELQSDEANYTYLALSWNHLGFFGDSYRYLWPPGYPFLLARAFDLFGSQAFEAIKALQVLASAAIGASTMLLARHLFGARAALFAGIAWCLYLPLAAFTHLLWTETFFLALFLPALLCLLRAARAPERSGGPLIAAGLLLGLSLYLREVVLFLIPALALWAGFGLPHRALGDAGTPGLDGLLGGLRRASLLLLAAAVVVFPWTLRNFEVYGRWMAVGTSMGENAYLGLNEGYRNFDLTPYARHLDQDRRNPMAAVRPWFAATEVGTHWERAEEIHNVPDRLAENASRGRTWVLDHPAEFLRTRLKKVADFVAPLSFFIRHQALGRYPGPLGAPALRRPLVLWALLCPLAALLAGIWGGSTRLAPGAPRRLIGLISLYFLATTALVSMSRFRLPLIPLAIVLGAGLLTARPATQPEIPRASLRRARLAAAIGTVLLLFLWWVDLPEVLAVLEIALA